MNEEKGKTEMTADEALMRLHDHITSKGGSASYVDMGEEELRAYNKEAKQRQRERERKLKAKGELPATDANVRKVLADAALMLLTADAPGAVQVRHALATAFPTKPGLPMTLEHKARTGRLKLQVVDPEKMAAVAKAVRAPREAFKAVTEKAAAAPVRTTVRIPPPAMLPVEDDEDFEVPQFLRKAHGEV